MNERAIPIDSFAEEVLPHLDSAYNLARWLVRNADDADDIVQEAYLRAFRYFDGFQGGTRERGCSRSCGTPRTSGCRRTGLEQSATEFDEAIHTGSGTRGS